MKMEKKCLPVSPSKSLLLSSLVFSGIACSQCSQNTLTCSTSPSLLGERGRGDYRGRGNYLRGMGKVLSHLLVRG